MKIFFVALLLLPLQAFCLSKPLGLKASGPDFSWSPVDGAALYRVAVWKPSAEKGAKGSLVAAVWVKEASWTYGDRAAVLAKVGKLASTKTPALEPDTTYKLWVAAVNEDGSDKSAWAFLNFSLPSGKTAAPEPSVLRPEQGTATASPSVTISPTPGPESYPAGKATASPTPDPKAAADLELDVADVFKATPEAGPKTTPTPVQTPSLDAAKALMGAGSTAAAEEVYKNLLKDDANNADAWEGLGDAYDKDWMKIEAKECYEKALAIDGSRDRLKQWLEENVRH